MKARSCDKGERRERKPPSKALFKCKVRQPSVKLALLKAAKGQQNDAGKCSGIQPTGANLKGEEPLLFKLVLFEDNQLVTSLE